MNLGLSTLPHGFHPPVFDRNRFSQITAPVNLVLNYNSNRERERLIENERERKGERKGERERGSERERLMKVYLGNLI